MHQYKTKQKKETIKQKIVGVEGFEPSSLGLEPSILANYTKHPLI